MLSYLSMTWNHRIADVTKRAALVAARISDAPSLWKVAFAKPGLFVWIPASGCERPSVISLPHGSGVVIGTLFPSRKTEDDHSVTCVKNLSEHDASDILKTFGRSLIRSHWGNYILFLVVSDTLDVCVLRAPMSSLPCFWTETEGLTLFFSRPGDVADLGLYSPTINWDHIRAQSVLGDYLCEETGLRGVYTLVSGDCIAVRDGVRTKVTYWSPSNAGNGATLASAAAASRLQSATRHVISSWSSLHRSVLVSLSGGFDSSVVLSTVAGLTPSPQISAVNFYGRRSGDERTYARSMARKYNVPLIEVELSGTVDLGPFLSYSRTASPALSFGSFATTPTYRRLAAESGASAVFTGELGDAIFGHAFGAELLAEALWRYKLTPKMLQVVMDYAALNRLSVWRAITLALSEYRLYRQHRLGGIRQRQRQRGAYPKVRLAADEAIALYQRTESRFLHPWYRDVANGPPGWLQIVSGMIMMTSTWMHSPFSDESDLLLFHPLASQPLVEAFLEIPTDLHVSGSENAAVARGAFASQLSPAVLSRGKGKGSPDLWLNEVILQNRPLLKELLLDGLLVRQGILDRRKVEGALSTDISRTQASLADIIVQLHIESWLRRWEPCGPPANHCYRGTMSSLALSH